jgi:two-component system response regulator AtoC
MDLYYRLNAFSLHMPALRERRDDIPVLARHFLTHFTTKYNKKTPVRFSPEAEDILLSYGWPGNVRELKNVIERIAVLENSEVIMPAHLPTEIITQAGPEKASQGFEMPDGLVLDDVEKNLIQQALVKANYNKTLAAKLLDISYDALRYRLKKYGLESGLL